MTALDLPEPSAAFMSGGVFSEKDGPKCRTRSWLRSNIPQTPCHVASTFSNSHYGLGERLLGSDGTIEHISGATDMVTGRSAEGIRLLSREGQSARWDGTHRKKLPIRTYGQLDRLRTEPQDSECVS